MDSVFLTSMNLRPIAISLSPNSQSDDILLALKILLRFNSWQKGNWTEKVSAWFIKHFKIDKVYLFSSGRSALYCLLKSFNIGFRDEVIIQSFTCVAVADPIIWIGAKPVYADLDASLNINPGLLEQYITKNTKAIIVQHTFGIPAEMEKIRKITHKHNLILIEDCAHSLGASRQGKDVGSFGDAAFFSFGRDKVISSVFGGAAFIRNRPENAGKLSEIYSRLSYPGKRWIAKQLVHPLAFFIILPLYNLYIGKFILYFLQNMQILSRPVEPSELSGGIPSFVPFKLPNALAGLAYHQLTKLSEFNSRRVKISKLYFSGLKQIKSIGLPPENEGAIYLRFNILTPNRDKIYTLFRRHKILLGLWYSNIIDPKGVEFDKVGYRLGVAKNAERTAKFSLNLPTYPNLADKQVLYIIELIKKYAG